MYAGIRDDGLRWLGKRLGYTDYFEGMRELGLKGLEIYVDRSLKVSDFSQLGVSRTASFNLNSEEELQRFLELVRKNGVKLSAILIENDFGKEDLQPEIKWMIDAAKVAPKLGIDVVRINSVMSVSPSVNLETYVEVTAKTIAQALKETEGVFFAIENHGVLGNDPQFIRAVIKKVGSERVGMNLDPGNFYWAGYPLSSVYSFVKEFAPIAKHMHVKNLSFPEPLREQRRDWCRDWPKEAKPVYEGDIDYRLVLQIMKDAGYDRDVTLEDESLSKYSTPEAIGILKKDAAYINDLIKELQ